MATLADVDLGQRIRAVHAVIRGEAGLSVEQRGELLAAAIWPAPVDGPAGGRAGRRGYPPEVRQAVVAAYRAGAASYVAVGERLGVPAPTVKDWVRRGR